MAKIPQSPSDLERHLKEQLEFLERSADAFDDGFTGEAKRMAVCLRILLHDTGRSTSLLTQLGGKDVEFVDSAFEDDPNSLVSHAGLLGIAVGKGETRLMARLDGDDPSWFRTAQFTDWWDAPVMRDLKGRIYTRGDIVLAVANKDGGAHVDPKLDEAYAELSRANALGIYGGTTDNIEPLSEPERVTIRQIAHEILKSLKPGYEKKPAAEDVAIIGGVSVEFKPSTEVVGPGVGRNDPCPCGSGLKFKKCHGKPGE